MASSKLADWLTQKPFTHRGLHDTSKGVPENSRAAFSAAADAGWGIELDVRLSADRRAVVFHDATLDAATDLTGPVAARTADELAVARLLGTAETIPTLEQALSLIGGRVPVLVEIKNSSWFAGPLEQAVLDAIKDYTGSLAVISFNNWSVRWFMEYASEVPRGRSIIGLWSSSGNLPLWRRVFGRCSNAIVPCDPDFLTVDLPALSARKRSRPIITWTVRSPQDRERAENFADNFIFEDDLI